VTDQQQQPTAEDVDKLQRALKAERQLHRAANRELATLKADFLGRIEALEQRQPAGPDMGVITSGLAAIRSDLRAELAALRGELQEVADVVHAFTRQP
jgi:hypothetical protein